MSSMPRGHRRAIWLLALALAAWVSPVHAQYFGRNRVQYERFDFRVLKTEHFDIYFYPSEEAAAAHALMESSEHVGKILLSVRKKN